MLLLPPTPPNLPVCGDGIKVFRYCTSVFSHKVPKPQDQRTWHLVINLSLSIQDATSDNTSRSLRQDDDTFAGIPAILPAETPPRHRRGHEILLFPVGAE